ncbi:hypothetical protein [Pseudanabaena sp. Chao 1811]|nr:hypothetical protein [Pseudanabaena sp. Chao 1811]
MPVKIVHFSSQISIGSPNKERIDCGKGWVALCAAHPLPKYYLSI